MLSEISEEYLECIFDLTLKGGPAKTSDIAVAMKIEADTRVRANLAVKILCLPRHTTRATGPTQFMANKCNSTITHDRANEQI